MRPGDTVPDLEVLGLEGRPVRLPGLATEATVLIFLRHLG